MERQGEEIWSPLRCLVANAPRPTRMLKALVGNIDGQRPVNEKFISKIKKSEVCDSNQRLCMSHV